MNKKIYKLFSLFIVFFTMFLINNSYVNAITISLPEYCTNPSSGDDIVNGHLCAGTDQVVQCNIAMVSSEEEGLPTKCPDDGKIRIKEGSDEGAKECKGYYYSFIDTPDEMFMADENHFTYRQVLCNGLTYKGEKLNYFYISNEKIKSVEESAPEFYNKVKSDIENGIADSEMGQKEAENDKENEKKSTIKNTDVDGLDPNSGSISINCSDFEALHIIYTIILIVAPILVIVFGSIDYSKAVMTSDLEKMDKFKKRFKPRLIAVIVLFLVPLLIKLLLSLNSDLSNTMLNCVVNGKDAEIKLNASEATGSSGVDTGSIKYKESSSSNDDSTGNGGGSSQSFGDTTNDTDTTVQQDSDGHATMPEKDTSSSGDCSRCAEIPTSYSSARSACEKANNCKIMNKK